MVPGQVGAQSDTGLPMNGALICQGGLGKLIVQLEGDAQGSVGGMPVSSTIFFGGHAISFANCEHGVNGTWWRAVEFFGKIT